MRDMTRMMTRKIAVPFAAFAAGAAVTGAAVALPAQAEPARPTPPRPAADAAAASPKPSASGTHRWCRTVTTVPGQIRLDRCSDGSAYGYMWDQQSRKWVAI